MTRLDRLRDVWESLAKRDALWAVLSDQSKVGGKWDVAEFMKTGTVEVETVFHILEYLAANKRGLTRQPGQGPAETKFGKG